MTKPTLHFYFDFISPYAYLAWHKFRKLAAEHDWQAECHPVVFAALLDHWGQLGPAEIPPKRIHVFKQTYRMAHRLGVPFAGPKTHPFRSIDALRLSLPAVAGDKQEKVIDALWSAGWGHGIEYSDKATLVRVLDDIGLDGSAMLAKTQEPDVKTLLHTSTKEAIEKGVFGVPTVVVGKEVFWGCDTFDDLLDVMTGKDPITPEVLGYLTEHRPSAMRARVRDKMPPS